MTQTASPARLAFRRVGAALVLGVLLGATAQYWNPYTRSVEAAATSLDTGYFEIAEDGSADHYYEDADGNTVKDQSWPAGTYPATGQWHFCNRATGEWSAICDTVIG